jgi:hypothetical protein
MEETAAKRTLPLATYALTVVVILLTMLLVTGKMAPGPNAKEISAFRQTFASELDPQFVAGIIAKPSDTYERRYVQLLVDKRLWEDIGRVYIAEQKAEELRTLAGRLASFPPSSVAEIADINKLRLQLAAELAATQKEFGQLADSWERDATLARHCNFQAEDCVIDALRSYKNFLTPKPAGTVPRVRLLSIFTFSDYGSAISLNDARGAFLSQTMPGALQEF